MAWSVVAAWPEPMAPRKVRGPLRPPAFGRLDVNVPVASDDAAGHRRRRRPPGHRDAARSYGCRLLASRVSRCRATRSISSTGPERAPLGPEGETWEPAGDGGGRLALELVPRSFVLRNAAFAWGRGYLYRPNPGAVAAAAGLAALTLVLVRRHRPTAV